MKKWQEAKSKTIRQSAVTAFRTIQRVQQPSGAVGADEMANSMVSRIVPHAWGLGLSASKKSDEVKLANCGLMFNITCSAYLYLPSF